MHTLTRKKIGWLAAGSAISLAAGVVGLPAASAAPRQLDVTGFTIKDMVFSSSSCQYNNVTVRGKVSGSVTDFYIDADVTRSGALVDWAIFDDSDLKDRLFICDTDGLGAYKVGPSDVSGFTADYDYFDYTDYSATTFYVRGKTRSGLASSRKGKVVTLNVSASYFNPAASKYSALNAKGVKIQRKTSKGWATIKTVNLSKGKSSFKYTQKAKASYRAVISQTAKTTAATSTTVKR